MYATQCVPFEGCKTAIPTSLENGPAFKYNFTSLGVKEERIF